MRARETERARERDAYIIYLRIQISQYQHSQNFMQIRDGKAEQGNVANGIVGGGLFDPSRDLDSLHDKTSRPSVPLSPPVGREPVPSDGHMSMSNGVKHVRKRLNSHATRRESEREREFVCGCGCVFVCGCWSGCVCVDVCGYVCILYSTHVHLYTSDSLTVLTLSVNISKLGEPSDYDIFFSA